MKRRSAKKILKNFDTKKRYRTPKNTHLGTGSGRKETKRWYGSGLGSALGLKARYNKVGYRQSTLSKAFRKVDF